MGFATTGVRDWMVVLESSIFNLYSFTCSAIVSNLLTLHLGNVFLMTVQIFVLFSRFTDFQRTCCRLVGRTSHETWAKRADPKDLERATTVYSSQRMLNTKQRKNIPRMFVLFMAGWSVRKGVMTVPNTLPAVRPGGVGTSSATVLWLTHCGKTLTVQVSNSLSQVGNSLFQIAWKIHFVTGVRKRNAKNIANAKNA
jgi:hypothetical protein